MNRQRPTGKDGPVKTMVCVTCGAEQFFDGPVEGELTCPNCGGVVFREFDTPAAGDQVAASAAEEEARGTEGRDDTTAAPVDELLDLEGGP